MWWCASSRVARLHIVDHRHFKKALKNAIQVTVAQAI
jgi:hypothetical protein